MNISLKRLNSCCACMLSSIRRFFSQPAAVLDKLSLCIKQFTFIFLYIPYWSKVCLQLYCISAYCISSFHFFFFRDSVWLCVQRSFHVRAHQTGLQINLSGQLLSHSLLVLRLKRQSELRWLTRQLKPVCTDLGFRPRRWTAVPAQRPPKVIHHEEFHFAS